MDIKRAKELINELTDMLDQIDKDGIYRMTEEQKTEIKIKIMAILNELEIRSVKYADRPF